MFNDQLYFEMKIGSVLKGFKEGKIYFAPTFKRLKKDNSALNLGSVPSWTDRILFKSNESTC